MKGVLDKFSGCKFVLKDLDDSIGNDKPREFSSASCLSDWLLCILFASLIEILCYRLKKISPEYLVQLCHARICKIQMAHVN